MQEPQRCLVWGMTPPSRVSRGVGGSGAEEDTRQELLPNRRFPTRTLFPLWGPMDPWRIFKLILRCPERVQRHGVQKLQATGIGTRAQRDLGEPRLPHPHPQCLQTPASY